MATRSGRSWYGYRADLQIGIAHIDQGLSGPKPAMINFGRASDPTRDPADEWSRGLVMENIWFKDSGYWTILVRGDDGILPLHYRYHRYLTVTSRCAGTTCASAAAT